MLLDAKPETLGGKLKRRVFKIAAWTVAAAAVIGGIAYVVHVLRSAGLI